MVHLCHHVWKIATLPFIENKKISKRKSFENIHLKRFDKFLSNTKGRGFKYNSCDPSKMGCFRIVNSLQNRIESNRLKRIENVSISFCCHRFCRIQYKI